MFAIFKRELKSYFSSPVGYVCVAALAALYGFFYFNVMITGSSSYIPKVYGSMFTFSMMIIPIITMKTMSEDRKNKTDQALITAPIGVTAIVMGKFLSSFAVYAIASVIGLLPAFAMAAFSNPPWAIVLGNFIATLLYGGAMISIGVLISSFTVSQVISAIATFVVSILLLVVDSVAGAFAGSAVGDIIGWFSFTQRYTVFTQGIFSIENCVFFLSVMAVFIFLTARKVESRRWN